EVVRLRGLLRDRGPFATGGKRGAAAADEPGRGDRVDDPLRADDAGTLERPEAAVGAVVVQRRRVHHPDPGKQPKPGLPELPDGLAQQGLRVGTVWVRLDVPALEATQDTRRIDRSLGEPAKPWAATRDRDQRRRSPLAEAQAG